MKPSYFIALVAPSEIETTVHDFKIDLHDRFGTKSALKSPAHITLYPPFHIEETREQEIKALLENTCQESGSFEIELNNFDRFSRGVLFIHVEPGKDLNGLQQRITGAFDSFLNSVRKKEKRPFHPHMTIGNRGWTEGGFEQALEEYKTKKFSATWTVKNVSLLKLRERWEIIYEAPLPDEQN
jgi:2'-5' RNA ligase